MLEIETASRSLKNRRDGWEGERRYRGDEDLQHRCETGEGAQKGAVKTARVEVGKTGVTEQRRKDLGKGVAVTCVIESCCEVKRDED